MRVRARSIGWIFAMGAAGSAALWAAPPVPNARGPASPQVPAQSSPARGTSRGRGVPAATATTSIPALPADAPVDPWQADLLKRLDSKDIAERNAARKELADIAAFWHEPEMLDRLAEETSDPALKHYFSDRGERLANLNTDFQRTGFDPTNLPRLSLHVSDVSTSGLAKALNKALGVRAFVVEDTDDPLKWSLDVSDKTLWEILARLEEQHPFTFTDTLADDNLLRIIPASLGLRAVGTSGPALIGITGLTYERRLDAQEKEGDDREASLTVEFGMLIDPRVVLNLISQLDVMEANDESGKRIEITERSQIPASVLRVRAPVFHTERPVFNVPIGTPVGHKISLKFVGKMQVVKHFESVTIEDVGSNLNVPIQVGKLPLRFTSIEKVGQNGQQPPAIVLRLAGNTIDRQGVVRNRVIYTLIDADGNTATVNTDVLASRIDFRNTSLTPPYRLIISAADGTMEVPLNVEIKDVPLP